LLCEPFSFRVYNQAFVDGPVLQDEAEEVAQNFNACMFFCEPNQVDPAFMGRGRDGPFMFVGVFGYSAKRLHKLKATHNLLFRQALNCLSFYLSLKQGPSLVDYGHYVGGLGGVSQVLMLGEVDQATDFCIFCYLCNEGCNFVVPCGAGPNSLLFIEKLPQLPKVNL
jgi:hypothetical protein